VGPPRPREPGAPHRISGPRAVAKAVPGAGRMPSPDRRATHAGPRAAGRPPRHRDRQRSLRWHGRLEPHAEGNRRRAPGRGGEVLAGGALDARPALGGPRAAPPRGDAARGLPRPQGAAVSHVGRPALRPRARVGPRRQDERLGPGQPPLLRPRLQGRGAGRLGDPLAPVLRRRGSLLRPRRAAHRRLRRRRPLRSPAREPVPAARAAPTLRRAADPEGGNEDRDAPRGRAPRQHDARDPGLSTLPLLRQLRARL
jgi:hypothetical protein